MTPSSAALANSSKRWRKSRSSLVTAAPPHGRQAPTGWAAASTSGKPPGVYRSCEPFTLGRTLQRGRYIFGAGNPPKERLDVVEGRRLDLRRSRRHRRVSDHDRPVLEKVRVAQRRLDAHVRRDPHHQKVPHAPTAEHRIEVGPVEPAVPRLHA